MSPELPAARLGSPPVRWRTADSVGEADLPGDAKIDMINVFRRSETIPDVVDEILAIDWPTKPVIWLQLGIRHDGAADRAREAGFTVVQDRCLKIEYPRLRPDDVTVA